MQTQIERLTAEIAALREQLGEAQTEDEWLKCRLAETKDQRQSAEDRNELFVNQIERMSKENGRLLRRIPTHRLSPVEVSALLRVLDAARLVPLSHAPLCRPGLNGLTNCRCYVAPLSLALTEVAGIHSLTTQEAPNAPTK